MCNKEENNGDFFVVLDEEKVSSKFGLVFPKNTKLLYNIALKSVNHPKNHSIWLRVESHEFERYNTPKEERERYVRKGFGIMTLPVTEFNNQVRSNGLKDRAITSNAYIQYNNKGEERKSGYVAFTYDNAYFGQTKKLAIRKLKNTQDFIL